MTPKQRLLAAIAGGETDRMSWSPNLAYWWEHSDAEIINMGEMGFLKSIGADPLIRGHYPYPPGSRRWDDLMLYTISYDGGCSIKETVEDKIKKVVYETPVGTLNFSYIYSLAGDTWFLKEHGVKTEADFYTLAYLKDHTLLTPNFARFDREAEKLGEDGLLIPLLTPDLKSSFQAMVEYWVGTEGIVYAVYDYPEAVDKALEAMRRLNMRAVEICAASKAECLLTWEDSSTTNISPAFYEEYIAPEITAWCEVLHKAGKYYMQHACGHLKQLLPIMAKTGIDCIESISPPPTGNIEVWEAREILPDNIALIGGVEAVNFLNLEVDDLMEYVETLIRRLGKTRYILANSDSCPPYVSLEKFQRIGKRVVNK